MLLMEAKLFSARTDVKSVPRRTYSTIQQTGALGAVDRLVSEISELSEILTPCVCRGGVVGRVLYKEKGLLIGQLRLVTYLCTVLLIG